MSAVRDILDDGLGGIQHNAITAKLEDLIGWARSRSSWPASFGLACCAIEMMGAGVSHYDLSRFGMEVFRASPRQADIMIVAGRASQKMAPVLRQVYDQMMEPKWVISMGVCASSGGMFNNYAIVQGVDQVVPVDVYAPGCPPTPETLIHAIETLHQLIEDGQILRRRAETGAGANVHVTEIAAGEQSVPVILGTRDTMTDTPDTDVAPETPAPPMLYGVPLSDSRGQRVLHPSRDTYIATVRALLDDTFTMCADLTAVDYLVSPSRPLPDGVTAERFEVVVNLLSLERRERIRLRVQVPADDPTIPTLFDHYPGSEAMEREVFDMFGIAFTDHPDLTRILMPEDWEGHPLRKDDHPSRIPVQFTADFSSQQAES